MSLAFLSNAVDIVLIEADFNLSVSVILLIHNIISGAFHSATVGSCLRTKP